MQINLFEIVAMIINFVLLLAVLYKILYKPVRQTMEERQKRIAQEIEKAEQRMALAEGLIKEYEEKLKDLQLTEKHLLDEAREKAQEEKDRLMESYRKESEDKKRFYLSRAEEEYHQLEDEFRKALGLNGVMIAEKILRLTDSGSLSASLFQHFLKKVSSLAEDLKNQYEREESHSQEEEVVLISAFPLSAEEKKLFEAELHSQFGKAYDISYEVDEGLMQGFELRLGSVTLHANIRRYLDESAEQLRNMLKSRT